MQMGLLLFLSSQIILIALSNNVVRNVGFFIDYSSSYSGPIEYAPTGITAPLPNYPLFVFILTLIVDMILIARLRRNNE
jgi:hypothetical protein